MLRTLALACSLILGCAAQAVEEPALVGTPTVIDGDTLEIHGHRIGLHGIDALESHQECTRADNTLWRCRQQAALALSDHIGRTSVRCEPRGHDRYAHVTAVCLSGADDLNRWMVAIGWAVAYQKYSLDYVADEERAHLAKVGVWLGTFEMPWDWRQQRRSK